MLAAFATRRLKGGDVRGGMGLGQSLGYALGSPLGYHVSALDADDSYGELTWA